MLSVLADDDGDSGSGGGVVHYRKFMIMDKQIKSRALIEPDDYRGERVRSNRQQLKDYQRTMDKMGVWVCVCVPCHTRLVLVMDVDHHHHRHCHLQVFLVLVLWCLFVTVNA